MSSSRAYWHALGWYTALADAEKLFFDSVVDISDGRGGRPQDWATAARLVKSGDVGLNQRKYWDGSTALQLAIVSCCPLWLCQLLVDRGSDPNKAGGQLGLHGAALRVQQVLPPPPDPVPSDPRQGARGCQGQGE